MIARTLTGVLLGGLVLLAQPAGETTTILVSLIGRPVGHEVVSSKSDGDSTVYTTDLDLTERNGRLQIASSMRLGADLTPSEFIVKGKSYRFVNVDTAVGVAGGIATVTNLGETKTFEAPRRFFTAQSYAPLSARALLINYWERHGRPDQLAVLPGEPARDVRVERRGIDIVTTPAGKFTLRRFSVDGVIWGRETVWLRDRFANSHPAARSDPRGSQGVPACAASVGDRGSRQGSRRAEGAEPFRCRRVGRVHWRARDRRHRQAALGRRHGDRARPADRRGGIARLDHGAGTRARDRRPRHDDRARPVGHARARREYRVVAGISGRRRHDLPGHGR